MRARREAEGKPVWSDANTLTFVYEADAEAVNACCAIRTPMSRFAGTDLWVLSVRVPDLAFATVQYGFLQAGANRLDARGSWRSPDAPVAPPRARTLPRQRSSIALTARALGQGGR